MKRFTLWCGQTVRVLTEDQLGFGQTHRMASTIPPAPEPPSLEVYWRPGCVYCANLRRALKRHGAIAIWHNIWEDDGARMFVADANGGNETVPTVRIGGRTLTNPSWSQLAALLGEEPRGEVSMRRRRADWVRALSWLPVGAAIVASFVLDGLGYSGLSWAMDGAALALWWVTRGLRG